MNDSDNSRINLISNKLFNWIVIPLMLLYMAASIVLIWYYSQTSSGVDDKQIETSCDAFYYYSKDYDEISDATYEDIKLVLFDQRILKRVDEKLVSLVSEAFEDGRITHSEMKVIAQYYKSSSNPRPQRYALFEEVEQLLSGVNATE